MFPAEIIGAGEEHRIVRERVCREEASEVANDSFEERNVLFLGKTSVGIKTGVDIVCLLAWLYSLLAQ